MRKYLLIFVSVLALTIVNCDNNNSVISKEDKNTVTDIDGNIYKTVSIGTQCWMAENLKVTHYQNGDEIEEISSHPNYIKNIDSKGRLYNWYTANDNRKIAPEGWHIPTNEDWEILEQFIGDSVAKKLKSISGWEDHHIWSGNGTDIFGFNIIPAMLYYPDGHLIESKGGSTGFWTSTEFDSAKSYAKFFINTYNDIYYSNENKGNGFSIRCIRN